MTDHRAIGLIINELSAAAVVSKLDAIDVAEAVRAAIY